MTALSNTSSTRSLSVTEQTGVHDSMRDCADIGRFEQMFQTEAYTDFLPGVELEILTGISVFSQMTTVRLLVITYIARKNLPTVCHCKAQLALILLETSALYKLFIYLLTYLLT